MKGDRCRFWHCQGATHSISAPGDHLFPVRRGSIFYRNTGAGDTSDRDHCGDGGGEEKVGRLLFLT